MSITVVQYLSLHTITVLPLTIVYMLSEVHCTLNVQYLTLSLHTITVLISYLCFFAMIQIGLYFSQTIYEYVITTHTDTDRQTDTHSSHRQTHRHRNTQTQTDTQRHR